MTSNATHVPTCITYALGMAIQNGAERGSVALAWLLEWDADGGLDNYGACTCNGRRDARIMGEKEITVADFVASLSAP